MKLSELNKDNIIEVLEEAMHRDAKDEKIPHEFRDFTDFQILANNREEPDYGDPVDYCPDVKDREYPTPSEEEAILDKIIKAADDPNIHTLHIDGFFRTPAPEYGEGELMTSAHWGFDIEVDCMHLGRIKRAVKAGKTVHWATDLYRVIEDSKGQWLIKCDHNGSCIGLTHTDGVTMNGEPKQFFISDKPEKKRKPQPDYNAGPSWAYPLPVIREELVEGDSVCDMHDWCVSALRTYWKEAEQVSFAGVQVKTAELLLESVGVELNAYNKSLILIDRTDDYLTFAFIYDGYAAGIVTVTIR